MTKDKGEPAPYLVTFSDEVLALAQEAGRVGIFEWHVPAGTLLVSQQFLVIYGLDCFDGRHESWLACVFREDVARIVDQTENAFRRRDREMLMEFRILRPGDGGLVWIEARSIIFYDADGRAIRMVGVNADITERKRAILQLRAFTETMEEAVRERTRELVAENEARRKAEELLRQAQKMEVVGQLTGGVAHDFNNLLTIVLGGLDIIGRQLPALGPSPEAERIAKARDMAVEGARRSATLTSRLLAFSRRQPLDPRPLDANKLIASTGELLHRTLGEQIALETVLAAGLWRVHADANQLENSLINLALNARDAMPTGGRMTIETANCHLDGAYVAGIAEPVEPGQYVMVAVTDSGLGMDKSTQEKAFEPFFTTKAVGQGTGLGLSQVYGFVRQSSGHIRIYSELGEGSTVKIYLPRYAGAEEAAPFVPPELTARAGGSELILVVEDDASLRGYTVQILTELGYGVLEAADGRIGLKVLAERGDIDLLFTDIVMPGGLNGRELADEAVKLHPALKVLFTTGYTRNAIVHHGRLDPGVHFLGKPFSFDELALKIRSVLDEDG
ncbi:MULTISPECIES: ATP-binding protein [Rhodomicrobium]|uniref:ATP-binding protein n=1 Tax=Rhodomicrobium TaxID=1068 RepID=UPI000B4A9923|nr:MULTISPECIES: ATP-binding protein [Rhodomicrobium]